MKIKTITCHHVYNAGASLQAYALAQYLREKGHEVQIIDYRPDYLSRHYRLDRVDNPRYDRPFLRAAYLLAKLPGRLWRLGSRKKRQFDRFTREYLPLTRRYGSLAELRENPPQAQVYLAGSDQIWNSVFLNGRDGAFYLTFAPQSAVRAAYAASFAVPQLPGEWAAQQKEWIAALDIVSVREESAVALLGTLGIDTARAVMDPVFLLPRSHWHRLALRPRGGAPYVLIYAFDENEDMARTARELAARCGWEIRSIGRCAFARRRESGGPRELLGLVENAQCVLTDSFHALAFSLIFQRPFLTFRRKEEINTRLEDLLRLAGLEERGDALQSIDWTAVQARLDERTERSRTLIDEVLHCAGEKG